jgi:isocitrate dehydrogenase
LPLHNGPDMPKVPITVAHGDGIGPEIMAATLRILEEAEAPLEIEPIEIGEKVYKRGFSAGIEPSAWESLRRTKVFLKSPITTPLGGGFKSLNVTIRKTLGLYANVRPCVAYPPFVDTRHPNMDVVIVRENEEDLYAGIEHRQTDDVTQSIKIITVPGSERIIRYAFEYARRNGRRKVTCFAKQNIMKLTDGLFYRLFDEIGSEYPDLGKEHYIIDIGSARLADRPEVFDVIVTTNLYGDIISDIAAEITGSVGLGGSANIGLTCAMFEAIHGSAPDIAGKGVANPSGLILGSVMMLVHLGMTRQADLVHNAWLKTLEDGIHTHDIHSPRHTVTKVGTHDFAQAVIERLGKRPLNLKPATYNHSDTVPISVPAFVRKPAKKETVGVDIFIHEASLTPDEIAEKCLAALPSHVELQVITNRGVKVWPEGFSETFLTDHFRLRFAAKEGKALPLEDIIDLQKRVLDAGLSFIKTEHLCTFDGVPGYSLGQGQ